MILAKIMIRESDQESEMEYDRGRDKKSDQKYDQGNEQRCAPSRRHQLIYGNSIDRCSMTESFPEGGGVSWGKADLAQGSLLANHPLS